MLQASSSGMLQPSLSAFKLGGSSLAVPLTKPTSSGAIGLVEKIREPLAPFVLQPPEEEDDNWDNDFEEGISFTKLQGTMSLFPMITHY